MFSAMRLQARTRALCISYSKDWILAIVVLVAFAAVDRLEPFHRQFSVHDTTIQHPYAKKETIPIWLCGVLAFIVPGLIISAVAIFQRKSYTDLHNGILGLVLTQALVLCVVDSVKIAVGRPRPDFLDRCLNIYDLNAAGTPLGLLSDPANMLSTSDICTRQELLRDGFKSFPSGHSAFSFGGLGYLSMYLAGKLHLFDERGHIYKSVVCLAPLVGASLITTSRVFDYRHHWQDVTVGAFIGSVFAVFSYRQYYPSLAAAKSGRPFAPRILDELLPTALMPHHHSHEREDDHNNDGTTYRESFLSSGDHHNYNRDSSTIEIVNATNLEDMSNHGSKHHNNGHGNARGGDGYHPMA
ncbi:hypothetical protein BGZ94_001581 [Podila epigama]|nr:hypothetical protein BGZ94_001581 [Podila epigama]